MKRLRVRGNRLSFEAVYRDSGKLKRVEVPAAATQEHWAVIGQVVPARWSDLDVFKERWVGKVWYEEVKMGSGKVGFVKELTGIWFAAYQNRVGVSPKFGPAQGAALKRIGNYLKSQGGGESEAVEVFRGILDAWDKLDAFSRERFDLLYLDSKLNIIIQKLKKDEGTREGYNFRDKV